MQHEHYTHTAPDIPSSTALSIFFFLLHFLLKQLLFFLLVPFQDFLHSLLGSRPILHFRFDFLLEIPRTPCTDQRAIPQNIVHHLFSKGCSILFPFSHTNPWYHIYMEITYWTTAFFFCCRPADESSRYSQSASLLAHNRITAPQFIRRSLHSSWYKQVPTHCLLLFAMEAGDLLDSVKIICFSPY